MKRTFLLAMAVCAVTAGCPDRKQTGGRSVDGPAAAVAGSRAAVVDGRAAAPRAPRPEEEQVSNKAKIDAEGLVVTVQAAARIAKQAPVLVRTTVNNPTGVARTFCDYHTPFEGIRNDIFVVLDARGKELPYRGMMAKRLPPGPDDYIRLEPGASRSTEVDLQGKYELAAGKYTVRYRGNGISGLPDSKAAAFEVSR